MRIHRSILASVGLLPCAMQAGDSTALTDAETSLWTRDTLTGDWGGARKGLADHGVSLELSTTAYYSGLLSGSGDESFEFGGRSDALIHLNTGKINAVDLLASDPFFGGWARDRFTNIAFVAPPSGVVPPTIMGGIFSYKLDPVTVTFMAFDPNDQTYEYWVDELFSDGVNLSIAAAVPFDEEQGVEIYYNSAVTPWFHVVPDLQWINPARGDFSDAWVASIRANLFF